MLNVNDGDFVYGNRTNARKENYNTQCCNTYAQNLSRENPDNS